MPQANYTSWNFVVSRACQEISFRFGGSRVTCETADSQRSPLMRLPQFQRSMCQKDPMNNFSALWPTSRVAIDTHYSPGAPSGRLRRSCSSGGMEPFDQPS